MKPYLLIIIALLAACKPSGNKNGDEGTRVFYTHDEFSMGADLSYVNQIIDFGGLYRDSGVITDPYLIFRKHGANTIRFRLWHNPSWTAEVYSPPLDHMYNDFADVKRGIAAAKENGMAVSLDIHYSDSWADPSKQVPPAAWDGLTLQTLHDSIYNYTYKVLNRLGNENLMPEYVQVGNEINPGFLLPQGDRWNRREDFVFLINAAISAVRDASATSLIKPRIIVHIAQPENAIYWFEGMSAAGLTDYDIAGISYYYLWSDVNIDSLSDYIAQLRSITGKEVMVVETAYPWTTYNADSYNNIIDTYKLAAGYPADKTGQYNYMVKLTQEVIEGGGIGVHYWEPAWITSDIKDKWGTGSSWDCNTLFDFTGNVLKGMDFMTYPYSFHK